MGGNARSHRAVSENFPPSGSHIPHTNSLFIKIFRSVVIDIVKNNPSLTPPSNLCTIAPCSLADNDRDSTPDGFTSGQLQISQKRISQCHSQEAITQTRSEGPETATIAIKRARDASNAKSVNPSSFRDITTAPTTKLCCGGTFAAALNHLSPNFDQSKLVTSMAFRCWCQLQSALPPG